MNTKNLDEKRNLLLELENKPTREIDQILAREWPETAIPAPAKRYINASKILVTLDFSEGEMNNLERLKALKSHQVKNLSELVSMLVDKELEKYNRTSKLKSKSKKPRQIKVSLKNHLLQKANYRCQYPGCTQDHFLQVDHIQAVHQGGGNDPRNLQILCQFHNQFKYSNGA